MPNARPPIIRVQSSMAAMLNAESSQASEPEDLYTPLPDDVPVHLSIRSMRALMLASVLSLGLGTIAYLMIDGFTFVTFDADSVSDTRKSEMLDEYNTYTGALSSVVSMPFQQVLALVLPVFFLCFATSAVVNENKSFVLTWAPVLAGAGVSWLLGQGLNAVNVQFDQPTIQFVISSSDLLASESSYNYTLVVTNVTSTLNVTGNPSNETFLRTAIHSAKPSPQTTCLYDSGWGTILVDSAILRFGFVQNSWLKNMLPTSVASDSLMSFSTSDEFTAGSVEASDFPEDWTLSKTADIFSYGIGVFNQFVNLGDIPRNIYARIDTSDATKMLTDMQAITKNQSWLNISTSEINVSFSSIELSPQIRFDSVTFELPTTWARMEGTKIGSDFYHSLDTNNQCNEHACIFQSHLDYPSDQVYVLQLCAAQANDTTDAIANMFADDCITTNNSALIFSFAQHLAVEQVDVTLGSLGYMNVTLKNARKIYSATIGKLSWQTTDLAQVYGAECSAEDGCDGLYFPLENVDQHLVLGEAQIPTLVTPYVPSSTDQWEALVYTNPNITYYRADLVYPPIYPAAEGSATDWDSLLDSYNCSFYGSNYINDMILRHVYSKDSMQPAYTAGLFWLFQNAALRDIQTTSKTQKGVQLDFDGNQSQLSARVSMPQTSALITIAGCVLIFLAGIFVPFNARRGQVQRNIQQMLSSAHNVASILFNRAAYPPLVIQASVKQAADDTKTPSIPTEDLREYRITEMTLRCKTDTVESMVQIADQQKDIHSQI